MAFDYLISARKLRGNQFVAEPGPMRFLKVPQAAREYDAGHVMPSARQWTLEVQGLADGDENALSISPSGDVLVFVHGYNNDIPAVLDRMRQLRRDLRAEGWRGEIVSFDWPSNNQILNYIEDRHDAAMTAELLVSQCIKRLMINQRAGCTTNVHLIGHSTGAYVILEAFAQSEKRGDLFKADWRIGQVALIAGDISRDSLTVSSDWSKPMFKRIMRLTNYSNGFDSVLAVSNAKRLGVAPRVGRVGLPTEVDQKAVNVDCSAYFQTLDPDTSPHFGTWPHSWHIGNRLFARDLAMTLEGAIDRHFIPTRQPGPQGHILSEGQRPAHQAKWGIKDSAKDESPRI